MGALVDDDDDDDDDDGVVFSKQMQRRRSRFFGAARVRRSLTRYRHKNPWCNNKVFPKRDGVGFWCHQTITLTAALPVQEQQQQQQPKILDWSRRVPLLLWLLPLLLHPAIQASILFSASLLPTAPP
jgi:hypothetical protein